MLTLVARRKQAEMLKIKIPPAWEDLQIVSDVEF